DGERWDRRPTHRARLVRARHVRARYDLHARCGLVHAWHETRHHPAADVVAMLAEATEAGHEHARSIAPSGRHRVVALGEGEVRLVLRPGAIARRVERHDCQQDAPRHARAQTPAPGTRQCGGRYDTTRPDPPCPKTRYPSAM